MDASQTRPAAAATLPAVVTFGLAIALGVFVSLNTLGANAPQEVPRGLLLALLLATPGFLGLAGALRREPMLLVAAGLLCLAQSVVAFSGVTLVFLIPAVLFLWAAGAEADGRRGGLARHWSGGVVAVAVVALVIGAWVSLFSATRTQCWAAREGPSGLVYESRPASDLSGPAAIEPGVVAQGCDGGALTLEGATLAMVLAGGAIVIAAFLPVRRAA